MQDELHPSTLAVTAGRGERQAEAPMSVPVTLTSAFHAGGERIYGRQGNPNWSAIEEALGALEGGRSLVFASGMGAVGAVMERLPVGSTVVMPFDAYHGVRSFVYEAATDGRLSYREVDVSDADATLEACEGADLLWLESPTNPLMNVADIASLAERAHQLGALVTVDNTFATPLLQRPLDLGADIVVHSITKYISGHSDLLLGAVVVRDQQTYDELLELRTLYGAVAGPMESWLALRGLRTLPLRLERAQDNAGALALRLDGHPAVTRVRYPGLKEDPGHELATRQMKGYGGMLCFEVASATTADEVTGALRLIVDATSLGGVETTIDRRSKYAGEGAVPDGLLRLNVGCEFIEDLWTDLSRALDSLN